MELGVDKSLRHWWVFLLRGLLFIAVGIYMIASPGTGYAALGMMFGLVVFIAGIVELLHVYRDNRKANRGWHLFLGIVDIILGVVLIGNVSASATILRLILGIWFLLRGLSLFSFSRLTGGSWVLKLGGIITIIFAGMIIFNSLFGAMTLVVITAMAFIFTGIFNVMLAFSLKQVYK